MKYVFRHATNKSVKLVLTEIFSQWADRICGTVAEAIVGQNKSYYANIAQFGDTNRCQIPFAWHDVDTIFSTFNGFSDMNLIEFFIS